MNQNQNIEIYNSAQKNAFIGALGAFLFALIGGGGVCLLFYSFDIISALSGIVALSCAMKGYTVFAKKMNLTGIVISTISAFLVIVIAWYLCFSLDVYTAYQEWRAEGKVFFTPTYWESIKLAPAYLKEPEIRNPYLRDLVLSLLLCALGCVPPVVREINKRKAPASPITPETSAEES